MGVLLTLERAALALTADISGESIMESLHELHHHFETVLDHSTERALPPLYYQWPQLGRELFTREHVLTDDVASYVTTSGISQQTLPEQEKRQKREKFRNAIIAQLYREEEGYPLDLRYLAFLLVKQGRGGELVGNPSVREQGGSKQALPYTGLEGYYAGSESTSQRPGMTSEDIIQEEANLGAELLKSLKNRAIENYSWANFARLKHILAGEQPTIEELKTLQLLWTEIVRRLHVRIYHNPEFEPTLTENIEHLEHLLFSSPFNTGQEKEMKKVLEKEYHRLMDECDQLSIAEQEQERQERARREYIRADRLEEFHQFRKATYELLAPSGQERYIIGVQDASLKEATITEAITLPDLPERSTYSPTLVHLTPKQLEGYLFLAHLGEVGGDPLVRSALVSDYSSY